VLDLLRFQIVDLITPRLVVSGGLRVLERVTVVRAAEAATC